MPTIPAKPTSTEILSGDPLASILKCKVPIIPTTPGTVIEMVSRKVSTAKWQINLYDSISGSPPVIDPAGFSNGPALYSGPGRPALVFQGATAGWGTSRPTVWSYSAVFKPVPVIGDLTGTGIYHHPLVCTGSDVTFAGLCLCRNWSNGSPTTLGVYRTQNNQQATGLTVVAGNEYAAAVTFDDSGATKTLRFFLYNLTTGTLISAAGGTLINAVLPTTNQYTSVNTDLLVLGNGGGGLPFQGWLADAAIYSGAFDDTLFAGYCSDPWSVSRGTYSSSSGSLVAGDANHLCATRTQVFLGASRPSGGVSPYTAQWSRASSPTGAFTPIAGATSGRLADTPPDDADYTYRCTFTDSTPGTPLTVNSPSVTVARMRKAPILWLAIADSIDGVAGLQLSVQTHVDKAISTQGRWALQHKRAISGSATGSWTTTGTMLPGAISAIKADAAMTGLPWYATVALGANDGSGVQTAYDTNVRAIVAELVAQGCAKVILHMPTFYQHNVTGYEAANQKIRDQWTILQAIAAANPTTVSIGDTLGPWISLTRATSTSGWHPDGDASSRIGIARGLKLAEIVDGPASYASATDVRSGVNRGDGTTGTLTVPSLANTKVGVAGDGGTGTYDGSDRWTDPGAANVRLGTAYKANSTTNNVTGTVTIPVAGDVRSGTTYGASLGQTGTLVVGAGGTYSDPGIANVKVGIGYTYNSAALTGTYDGSDRYTDPGVANVRVATAYKVNSTTNNRTGTLALPTVGNVATGVQFGAGGTEFTGTLAGGGGGVSLAALQGELDSRGLTSSFSTATSSGLGSIKSETDKITATISKVDAIKAKADNLPTDPADASDIAASFSGVATTLAAIRAKTDTIQSIAVSGTATGTPTTTLIQGTGSGLVSTNYAKQFLVFTSGLNTGVPRRISAYNSTTKTFTTDAFPDTPVAGDTFVVMGIKEVA